MYHNAQKKDLHCHSLLSLPRNHAKRRDLWIAAIKRDKWPEKSIDNARICGKYFLSVTSTEFSYMGTIRTYQSKIFKLNKERAELVTTNRRLRRTPKAECELQYKTLKRNIKKFKFYTGLIKPAIFEFIVSELQTVETVCKLDKNDHVLVILVKLRLGLMNKDLAYRFGITETAMSKIFECGYRNFYGQAKKLSWRIYPGVSGSHLKNALEL